MLVWRTEWLDDAQQVSTVPFLFQKSLKKHLRSPSFSYLPVCLGNITNNLYFLFSTLKRSCLDSAASQLYVGRTYSSEHLHDSLTSTLIGSLFWFSPSIRHDGQHRMIHRHGGGLEWPVATTMMCMFSGIQEDYTEPWPLGTLYQGIPLIPTITGGGISVPTTPLETLASWNLMGAMSMGAEWNLVGA